MTHNTRVPKEETVKREWNLSTGYNVVCLKFLCLKSKKLHPGLGFETKNRRCLLKCCIEYYVEYF